MATTFSNLVTVLSEEDKAMMRKRSCGHGVTFLIRVLVTDSAPGPRSLREFAGLTDTQSARSWLQQLCGKSGEGWEKFFWLECGRHWSFPGEWERGRKDELATLMKFVVDREMEYLTDLARKGENAPYQALTEESHFNLGMNTQLCWRGDDRAPNLIMGPNGTGFRPKIGLSKPLWRPAENDVDTETTVCAARDVRGSAFFPMDKSVKYTYLYSVVMREGWNTAFVQERLDAKNNPPADDRALWLFYEECTQSISPQDIVLAYKAERLFVPGAAKTSDGIRFYIHDMEAKNEAACEGLTQPQKDDLELIDRNYRNCWYPHHPWFLSYTGLVQANGEKLPLERSGLLADAGRMHVNPTL